MPRYIFRLDDIAPNMCWECYDCLCRLFDRYDVKPLLGVIPDNQDPDLLRFPHRDDFWEHICGQMMRGWDIACHGYRHVLDSPSGGILNINPCGEFAGQPEELQRERLAKGLAILRGHGIQTDVFMAPAHSYDEATLSAMRKVGLTKITDGYSLYPYEQEGILHVPQLFAQPRYMPFGVYTFCLHPNELTREQLTRIERFLQRFHRNVVPFKSVEANRSRPVGSALLRSARQVLSHVRTHARRLFELRQHETANSCQSHKTPS